MDFPGLRTENLNQPVSPPGEFPRWAFLFCAYTFLFSWPTCRRCFYGYRKIKGDFAYRQQGLGYKRIDALTGYSLNTVKSVCRRNPDSEEKLCPQCGAKLTNIPHHREKKFCSDACRMAWWNSHPEAVNRKAIYHFICPRCGQHFDSYGNSHRKYCSRTCYAEARRKGV